MMLFDKLRYTALALSLTLGAGHAEAAPPSPMSFPNWYAPKGYLTELSASLKAAQAEQRSVSIIQLGDSHMGRTPHATTASPAWVSPGVARRYYAASLRDPSASEATRSLPPQGAPSPYPSAA